MVRAPIFQLVGYQNSGKTTTMYEVIQRLSSDGFKIVTIKHHGHGGKPDIVEKKDSGRHVNAGALGSIIEGEGRILLQAEQTSWSLEAQILLANALTPDLILIEGHKQEKYPKAVLLRNDRDKHLLNELNSIQAVYCIDSNCRNDLQKDMKQPFFNDKEDFYRWVVNHLKSTITSEGNS
ncbi:molybdopterin-guanine dinucleotide biosynthesis protein B [Mesobacillus maritimus]|uniref:molybdopterin-guanine dinucleotide biosynthesis protein B n=1 Tax=Mesobacillus maritimus TaxID=1643336 RepID=UPI002040A05E|nr:molybdopterin-guanine dinucleotide biosynthesis protein B [Mesobacillus maritimus]MCM3667452.1 molybdopterin-guanine dinucleotide biosynthesis protein B [Mesobacillus maritimus]